MMKDVLVEAKVVKEIFKLLDYTRCMAIATGYKTNDKPNLDYISRKLGELQCSKDI